MTKMRDQAAKRRQDAGANAGEQEQQQDTRRSSEGTAVSEEEPSPQFEKIKTQRSSRPNQLTHTLSGPYDIDRVNTRDSFSRTKSGRSR